MSRLTQPSLLETSISFFDAGGSVTLLPGPEVSIPSATDSTAWSTRGWILQECVLSRRSVISTKESVYSDSQDFRASESHDLGLKKDYIARPNGEPVTTGSGVYDQLGRGSWSWRDYVVAVQEYTRKDLTHPDDRLDAFTGILNAVFHRGVPIDYRRTLSGLLYDGFVQSLHWNLTLKQNIRQPIDARSSRYLISWSWIGWKGIVSLDAGSPDSDESLPIKTTPIDIVDAANIVCYCFNPPSDFRPQFTRVEKPLRVMLHLWAKTLSCHLTWKQHFGTNAVCKVKCNHPEIVSSDDYDAEAAVGAEIDLSLDFELVCLDVELDVFILIQHGESFAERVDLVRFPSLRLLTSRLIEKYTRLC